MKRFDPVYRIGVLLIASAAALFAEHAVEHHEGREVASQEILVQFTSPDPNAISAAGRDMDADKIERISHMRPLFRVHSRTKRVRAMLDALGKRDAIEFAEPNYIIHLNATPYDTNFTDLWGLRNTGQSVLGSAGKAGADISATAAWDISTGSTANVVAVIDTGIDYTHPDLAANVWSAPSSFSVMINGATITCPAGSHGFNAITNSCDPKDDHAHGTHVSGTIGAVGNNSMGVTGVNWVTRIMGIKFLDANGSGSTADAIKGIDFAIQAKVKFGAAANVRVLSASWGGPDFSQALSDAISRANASDMLFVAAAGNSGQNNDLTPNYPASMNQPNVISVAAVDNNDQLASFSNFGANTVHLAAPGVSIYSTVPGGGYTWFNGTSMATPHVSGAAMLILSRCSLNVASLRSLILSSVDSVTSLAGRTSTGGRLNVARALSSCAAPAPTPTPTPTPTPAPGFTPIRVNAGGGAYTDPAGQVWSADTGYVSGITYKTTVTISNTTTVPLYQTHRWNYGTLQYRFSVPNGTYTVKLKFAEATYTTPGRRAFNIALNGQTVQTNFDPLAAAGAAYRAVDRSYALNVTTGKIALDLTAVVDNPEVNAIEITAGASTTPDPAPAPAPTPTPGFTPIRVNAGGGAYTDPAGQVWSADKGYVAGITYSTTAAIANTTTAPLYQTHRWNYGTLQYRFSVPNGTYTVKLKFAEATYTAPGRRVFNIALNGQTVQTNFDPLAAAGAAYRAIDRSYAVNVTTGQVALDLTAVIDNPEVNAIEITAGASTTAMLLE